MFEEDMIEIQPRFWEIKLEDARKDVTPFGDPHDENDPNRNLSEWALVLALSAFPKGKSLSAEKFKEELKLAMFQQILDDMVAKNILSEGWSEEDEGVIYWLNDEQKKPAGS